jgi:hypothetical protein
MEWKRTREDSSDYLGSLYQVPDVAKIERGKKLGRERKQIG